MSAEHDFHYPEVPTFNKDGRIPLHILYEAYFSLVDEGWKVEKIYEQEAKFPNGEIVKLPVYGFLSPSIDDGPEWSLWHVDEIHGEEPSTLQAAKNKIDVFKSLPYYGIPAVCVFGANPVGYIFDMRYYNQSRRPNFGPNFGKSVGDFEHLIPTKLVRHLPRHIFINNETADTFAHWILRVQQQYKPLLVMDHHEDEFQFNILDRDWDSFYSYAYGERKILQVINPELVRILEKSGYPMKKNYVTRFHEETENGFVINARDGSLDQFFIENQYLERWKRQYNYRRVHDPFDSFLNLMQYIKPWTLKTKYAAKAVFTLETVIHHENPQPISDRSKIHEEIIDFYPDFYKIVKEAE